MAAEENVFVFFLRLLAFVRKKKILSVVYLKTNSFFFFLLLNLQSGIESLKEKKIIKKTNINGTPFAQVKLLVDLIF